MKFHRKSICAKTKITEIKQNYPNMNTIKQAKINKAKLNSRSTLNFSLRSRYFNYIALNNYIITIIGVILFIHSTCFLTCFNDCFLHVSCEPPEFKTTNVSGAFFKPLLKGRNGDLLDMIDIDDPSNSRIWYPLNNSVSAGAINKPIKSNVDYHHVQAQRYEQNPIVVVLDNYNNLSRTTNYQQDGIKSWPIHNNNNSDDKFKYSVPSSAPWSLTTLTPNVKNVSHDSVDHLVKSTPPIDSWVHTAHTAHAVNAGNRVIPLAPVAHRPVYTGFSSVQPVKNWATTVGQGQGQLFSNQWHKINVHELKPSTTVQHTPQQQQFSVLKTTPTFVTDAVVQRIRPNTQQIEQIDTPDGTNGLVVRSEGKTGDGRGSGDLWSSLTRNQLQQFAAQTANSQLGQTIGIHVDGARHLDSCNARNRVSARYLARKNERSFHNLRGPNHDNEEPIILADYPSHVGLYNKSIENLNSKIPNTNSNTTNSTTYLCAGTLWNSQWILTSAECVLEFFDRPYDLIVRLDEWYPDEEWNISSEDKRPKVGVIKNVAAIFVHHNYMNAYRVWQRDHNLSSSTDKFTSADSNLAMLKLATPIDWSSNLNLAPACTAPNTQSVRGRLCWTPTRAVVKDETFDADEGKYYDKLRVAHRERRLNIYTDNDECQAATGIPIYSVVYPREICHYLEHTAICAHETTTTNFNNASASPSSSLNNPKVFGNNEGTLATKEALKNLDLGAGVYCDENNHIRLIALVGSPRQSGSNGHGLINIDYYRPWIQTITHTSYPFNI